MPLLKETGAHRALDVFLDCHVTSWMNPRCDLKEIFGRSATPANVHCSAKFSQFGTNVCRCGCVEFQRPYFSLLFPLIFLKFVTVLAWLLRPFNQLHIAEKGF